MKAILNLITLVVVAIIGYIIWKTYQSVSAASTSISADASAAKNAITSPFTTVGDWLFGDTTPPSTLTGDYYTDKLFATTATAGGFAGAEGLGSGILYGTSFAGADVNSF